MTAKPARHKVGLIGALGVCRIGRTGAGDGELWCGEGGMSRGPSRAQSGIGLAAEMGYN